MKIFDEASTLTPAQFDAALAQSCPYKMDPDWMEKLRAFGCEVVPCGSQVTCNPPPVRSDHDYLVKIPSDDAKVAEFMGLATELGFDWEGSEHYQDAASVFMSWRSEANVNLIATRSDHFWNRHIAATAECKRLNLMDKADRIALFQLWLYGNVTSDPLKG